MNDDFGDKMDKNSPEDTSSYQDEDYRFLSEIHKRRTLTVRQVLLIVFCVCALAVLFGVIAAAVFSAVSASYSEKHPNPVHMNADSETLVTAEESDAESQAASSLSPTPDTSAVGTGTDETSVSGNTVSSDAAPEAAGGSDEETQAEEKSLANYEALNSRMTGIGNEARKSVVHVMGIKSTEDWLHNTDTSTVTKTGLIVADTGDRLMILTDNEGIDGAQKIAVEMPDNTIVGATFIKKDPVMNLAVISVAENDLDEDAKKNCSVADLGNSYGVKSGDSVIAIGSPLGYSGSVVYGEVTSVTNTVSVTDGEYSLITTDIQGSSSGNGFLINTDGQVIGMISQKYATENASVVIAIPVSPLKQLTEALCNNDAIGYAGIVGQTVSAEISRNAGIPAGVYVTEVEADSPALAAGLAVGDVITEMDGQKIGSMRAVHNEIAALKPGTVIPVTVERQGADGYVKFKFELTIGEAK